MAKSWPWSSESDTAVSDSDEVNVPDASLALLESAMRDARMNGVETGITLLINGAVVSGLVTAPSYFARWLSSTQLLAALAGGPMPGGESTPPTEEERSAVKAAWQAKGDAAHEAAIKIVLRDVRIYQAGPYDPICLAYMVVEATTVDGVSIGQMGPGPQQKS